MSAVYCEVSKWRQEEAKRESGAKPNLGPELAATPNLGNRQVVNLAQTLTLNAHNLVQSVSTACTCTWRDQGMVLGTFAGACRSRGRREAGGGGDLDGDDRPQDGQYDDGDVDGVKDAGGAKAN